MHDTGRSVLCVRVRVRACVCHCMRQPTLLLPIRLGTRASRGKMILGQPGCVGFTLIPFTLYVSLLNTVINVE